MSEDMNLSVNGQSKVPPGFRFHPTEEELLHYYLTKKVSCQKIDLDVIRDVDLNKLEPWDIQERCKIGSTPQNDWYFFSHKDKKYPTGTRTNRATAAGFWKATGRDKAIHSNLRRIGMRKTLVFYRGRAPHGQKSDWIMHEYRLELEEDSNHHQEDSSGSDEGWVVCRVFKKKNYHKSMDSSLIINNPPASSNSALDHILMYMGRSTQEKEYSSNGFNNNNNNNIPSIFSAPGGFMQLPSLQEISPKPISGDQIQDDDMLMITASSDWAAVDRLVASQLNGQPSKQFSIDDQEFSFCFDHHDHHDHEEEETQLLSSVMMNNNNHNNNNSDYKPKDDQTTDLWSFGGRPSTSSSSSDPLCHLSV